MLYLDWKFSPYVFVYGTLKRGRGNNALLSDSEFIGEAYSGKLGALGGHTVPFFYPEEILEHLGQQDSIARIKGEVWKTDSSRTLRRLDTLEGHPNFYYRSLMRANLIEHQPPDDLEYVWCYFSDASFGQLTFEHNFDETEKAYICQ